MMKKTITICALVSLFIASSGFADKIRNNNVSVRTMPGAFYPVVTVLNSGDTVKVLEKKDQWKKVKTSAKAVGWVSANAFNSMGGSVDYGVMARATTKRGMSKIMVTAAVKGFFDNKINDKDINKAIFENPYVCYVDPVRYSQFVSETYNRRWSREKFYRKTSIQQQGPFRIDENLVALSSYICARMAAPGLSTNQALTAYVNNVAQLIMESTEFYDLPVC
ncbi:MAG: SH3 domain-containing protein, partial [Desulfobacteraceae bacterium]|nr:SH3 domain-containing protein [Desulfobacteraceae bacterium]